MANFNGECEGGPNDGEHLEAAHDRVPIVKPGADTEGQLLGYYVHANDAWAWEGEPQPDEADRLR